MANIINSMIKLDTSTSVAGVLSLDFTNSKQYSVADVTGDDLTLSVETEIVSTSYGATAYLYMVNTDTTNQVLLKTGAAVQWGVIEPGEWVYFAVPDTIGLKIAPSTGSVVVNYVLMKKA